MPERKAIESWLTDMDGVLVHEGVPVPGARIAREYLKPDGSLGGALLPTGQPRQQIKLADGREIDAVFSDVMMPGGMSGVALARELSIRRSDLAVLLTTGVEASARDAIAEGIQVILKPYTMATLATALEAIIKRRSFQRPKNKKLFVCARRSWRDPAGGSSVREGGSARPVASVAGDCRAIGGGVLGKV